MFEGLLDCDESDFADIKMTIMNLILADAVRKTGITRHKRFLLAMVTIWTRGSNLNIEQIRTARAKKGYNIAVNLIYASHLVICQAQSPAIPLSKELSALVSFEQLSLMEPTSSQFAKATWEVAKISKTGR